MRANPPSGAKGAKRESGSRFAPHFENYGIGGAVFAFCVDERRDDIGKCGVRGKLFEQKKKTKENKYMKPVSPVIPGETHEEIIIAESQDEYENLPAIPLADGVILTRWKLDAEDLKLVNETGDVYLLMWTFGNPVMPVLLTTGKPQIVNEVKNDGN